MILDGTRDLNAKMMNGMMAVTNVLILQVLPDTWIRRERQKAMHARGASDPKALPPRNHKVRFIQRLRPGGTPPDVRRRVEMLSADIRGLPISAEQAGDFVAAAAAIERAAAKGRERLAAGSMPAEPTVEPRKVQPRHLGLLVLYARNRHKQGPPPDAKVQKVVGAVSATNLDLNAAATMDASSCPDPGKEEWSDICASDTTRRLLTHYGNVWCPYRCDQKLLSGLILAAIHFEYKNVKGSRGFWKCTDLQYTSLRGMPNEIHAIYAGMSEEELKPFTPWSEVKSYYNEWFRNYERDRTHGRLPSRDEHLFVNQCVGFRAVGTPALEAPHPRNPSVTDRNKVANAEALRVIMDACTNEHIPELEYDSSGRVVTPFIIPPGKRFWSQCSSCNSVSLHDDKTERWRKYMCLSCCAWERSWGETWCGIMPEKYAVHPEREQIEQSLLSMEAKIVTHMANVTCLSRDQRCREHVNIDHAFECKECARTLDAVNAMLENNKDQIIRYKNLRAESAIVSNAYGACRHPERDLRQQGHSDAYPTDMG